MVLREQPTSSAILRLFGAVALVLLASLGVIVTAQADGTIAAAAQWNAGRIPLASGQSRNWSGYVATGGSFTSVAGTWTVPALTPGQTVGSDATWVGIGGVSSNDLIQAGTEETASRFGQVRYNAWIETLPQASKTVALTVNPGNSVSVSLVQQAAGTWHIQLTNNTTNQNVQQTIAYASSLSSAEWIQEAPSSGRGLLPLANFGTLHFSNGSTVKNGTQDTIARAAATTVTMVGARGQIEATPSALGSDGASFAVTYGATASVQQPGVQPGTTTQPRSRFRQSPWTARWDWWSGGGLVGASTQASGY